MNEHDLITRLSALPDRDLAVDIDLDNVIAAVKRSRKRRRAIAGTILATATLVAGLIMVTSQIDRPKPLPPAEPNPWKLHTLGVKGAFMTGIAAISPTDVWTVGMLHPRPTQTGLAMHWNGAGWKQFDFPTGYALSDVAAVTSNDVWAVGANSQGTNYVVSKPLALHWNGETWQEISVPEKEGGSGLSIMVAIAPDDVWAAGSSTVRDGHPYIVHWDGKKWQKVNTPAVPGAQGMILRSISATGPNDIWISGVSDASPGERPLALHWDGQGWSTIPVAEEGDDLNSILALAPDDVWAVGRGKTYRFDGSRWQTVQVPEEFNGSFRTLAPDGNGGILLGGQRMGCQLSSCQPTPGAVQPGMFATYWTGSVWVPVKPPLNVVGTIQDTSLIPGTRTIWTVGGYLIPATSQTVNLGDEESLVASISL